MSNTPNQPKPVVIKAINLSMTVLGVLFLMPGMWSANSPLPGISVSRTKLEPGLEKALFSAQTDADIEALQAIAQEHGYEIEVCG